MRIIQPLHSFTNLNLSLLLCIALVLLGGCSQEPGLVVDIGEWPAGAQVLHIRSVLDEEPGQELTVPSGQTRFVVYVPEGRQGTLRLDLIGIDSGGCTVAEGNLASELGLKSPLVQVIHASLSTVSPARCSLTLHVADGLVVSNEQGHVCTSSDSPCTIAGFGPISLRAKSDDDGSIPVWTQGCTGYGPCSLTLNRSKSVFVSAEPRRCTPDGVCVYHPIQAFTPLAAAHDTESASWIVGADGQIFRCHDHRCEHIQSGVLFDLYAAASSLDGTVFVVGEYGTVLHCAGSSCQALPTGTQAALRSVSTTASGIIYAVGDKGTVVRCDGNGCAGIPSITTSNLRAVITKSDEEAWATGDLGVVLKCSGTNCRSIQSGTIHLRGIAVDASGWIWTVGDFGLVQRCSDAGCQVVATDTSFPMVAVVADSHGQIYSVSRGNTVHTCRPEGCIAIFESSAPLSALAAAPDDVVWAVGRLGAVIRCAQGSCESVLSGTENDLFQISVSPSGEAWALGDRGSVLRCQGQSCTATASGPVANLRSVAEDGTGTAWAVGDSGMMLRCTSSGCTKVITNLTGTLNAVERKAPGFAWAIGEAGEILACTNFDCKSMVNPLWPRQLKAVALDPSGAAWIGGNLDSSLVRCSPMASSCINLFFPLFGVITSLITSARDRFFLLSEGRLVVVPIAGGPAGGASPFYIRGISANPLIDIDLWAVGDGGKVAHFCGTNPCPQPPSFFGTTSNLLSVSVSASGTVFAAGEMGTVVKCSGATCVPEPLKTNATTNRLVRVGTSSSGNAWIVGDSGTMIECSASGCRLLATGTRSHLIDLRVTPDGTVWSVGEDGMVLRRDRAYAAKS